MLFSYYIGKMIIFHTELGKMKDGLSSTTKGDELPNDTIIEACLLKDKAYCYRLQSNSVDTTVTGEEKKLEGITKATIKNQITTDYKNAIYGKSKYLTNYKIDSNKHHLETIEQYKIAKDPFDDKGIKDRDGVFKFYYY